METLTRTKVVYNMIIFIIVFLLQEILMTIKSTLVLQLYTKLLLNRIELWETIHVIDHLIHERE